MSEFTLPANSKVGKGKHWALPRPTEHVKSFRIYRWDPAKDANPQMDTFDIDRDHCGPMVLDALVKQTVWKQGCGGAGYQFAAMC